MLALFLDSVANFIAFIALIMGVGTALLFFLIVSLYKRIDDSFEKHADKAGLALGLSIMGAGVVVFVVGTVYYLFVCNCA